MRRSAACTQIDWSEPCDENVVHAAKQHAQRIQAAPLRINHAAALQWQHSHVSALVCTNQCDLTAQWHASRTRRTVMSALASVARATASSASVGHGGSQLTVQHVPSAGCTRRRSRREQLSGDMHSTMCTLRLHAATKCAHAPAVVLWSGAAAADRTRSTICTKQASDCSQCAQGMHVGCSKNSTDRSVYNLAVRIRRLPKLQRLCMMTMPHWQRT